MVFRRRNPLTWAASIRQVFYPQGGWLRAVWYVLYRLRRLPDPAHKIARGVAAGVFVSFTPLFGVHFFLAAGLAWVMGGNMMAAVLATFFGNPITFPLIVAVSMECGSWLLDRPMVPLNDVVSAFGHAATNLWSNALAVFTPAPVEWSGMSAFFEIVFLPYLVGGLVPGVIVGLVCYYLTLPIVSAYQKARLARLKKRFARKRERVISRRLETPK